MACTNFDACPPVNCVGSFVNSGTCNGTCGGKSGRPVVSCALAVSCAAGYGCNLLQSDSITWAGLAQHLGWPFTHAKLVCMQVVLASRNKSSPSLQPQRGVDRTVQNKLAQSDTLIATTQVSCKARALGDGSVCPSHRLSAPLSYISQLVYDRSALVRVHVQRCTRTKAHRHLCKHAALTMMRLLVCAFCCVM